MVSKIRVGIVETALADDQLYSGTRIQITNFENTDGAHLRIAVPILF